MSDVVIPYEQLKGVNAPYFEAYEKRFHEVLHSGWYVLGKEVTEFEKAFATYHAMPEAVGLASGLDALILALMALDLPPQSEVLVAANAYVACVLSIVRANCIPVMVEPDPNTGNIDIKQIEAKITTKTRAIMPVHLYGNPCDMAMITEIASQYKLAIIEDCAQAHGAEFLGKKVGAFSTISAFSFYPTKNLGALGDGGAVLTRHVALAQKLKALRNYGSQKKYHNDYMGLNSRLDEMQAAFLSVKLPHLDQINAHKRQLAALYDEHLDPQFKRLTIDKRAKCVYHIYPIFHENRDALRAYLTEKGIQTEIHYPIPPHQQPAYQYLFEGQRFPVSEKMHQTILSLPISVIHTKDQVLKVCDVMNDYLKRNAA